MIQQYFKKHGGFKLIEDYIRNRVFVYACVLFLVLPKNRKGLEILKDLITYRKQKKLEHQFRYLLKNESFLATSRESLSKPRIIWICWFQGMENAPEIVQKCFESVKKYCWNYDIKVLTNENLFEYVTIAPHLIKKWKDGIITNTLFSDIVRSNVLMNYGGYWVDATCYFTNTIPEDIERSNFFLFRTQKPGDAGHFSTISSWFIASVPQHPYMIIMNHFFDEYFSKYNIPCDYFLFHLFLELVLDYNKELSVHMPSYTNENPHLLLYQLDKPFSSMLFESIKAKSFVHKLTYKISNEVVEDSATFFSTLIKNQIR